MAAEPIRQVAVIGGGPAGLMAAEVLAQGGARVTVYERMPTFGRKFLLAGRGGLNLTHSEPPDLFLSRYREARDWLAPSIERFPATALRQWCEALGEPTFVGSSGRVFPRSFKASPLLRAWLRRLAQAGVVLRPRHRWLGWDAEGGLRIAGPEGELSVRADATILALGGASWPHLGADGGWAEPFRQAGIDAAPLRPANCGFEAGWTAHFADRFAGAPLKTIALTAEGETRRGELVVTRAGIEGGVVYALGAPIREAIARSGSATVFLDLRPDAPADVLAARLERRRRGVSLGNALRKELGLSPVAAGLLHETALGEERPLAGRSAAEIAALVRRVPVRLVAPMPLARAISSAGGVRLAELDGNLMLRRRPGHFLAGEMLDWEAPTGGYLLQACFATGAAAGRGALAYLRSLPGTGLRPISG